MAMMMLEQQEKERGTGSPFSGINLNQKILRPVVNLSMDQQLVDRALKGDRQAFQRLLQSCLPNMLSLAHRMLNDQALAEDLAQEVMLKVWNKLDTYDASKAKLSTWIYKITANLCLDHLRRRREDQLDEDYDAPVSAQQHQDLFNKQIRAQVDDILSALPERQRLALVLFHYQGHSLQEISQIMACSRETTESLLSRARRSLKTSLKPVWQQLQDDER